MSAMCIFAIAVVSMIVFLSALIFLVVDYHEHHIWVRYLRKSPHSSTRISGSCVWTPILSWLERRALAREQKRDAYLITQAEKEKPWWERPNLRTHLGDIPLGTRCEIRQSDGEHTRHTWPGSFSDHEVVYLIPISHSTYYETARCKVYLLVPGQGFVCFESVFLNLDGTVPLYLTRAVRTTSAVFGDD